MSACKVCKYRLLCFLEEQANYDMFDDECEYFVKEGDEK